MLSGENGNGNGMIMPVAPMYGGYGGGFGNSFGGDWGWIILLLLLAGGGWGNGFGGWGGMGGFAADGAMLYPWMNQAEITTQGFQNQALGNQLTAVQSDLGDIQAQLCNGFAGVTQAVSNGFAQAEIAENSRQMANMQQAFNAQVANMQGFNNIQAQQAECCCENRLAIAGLNATIASEECATRANSTQNTQAILNLVNSGIQSIKDQMCQDKIDAKNDEIAQLRQEVLFARGQASQIAQNQQVIDGIYNRLDTCPVGTTPIYGRTPIFTCNNGCGCNGNF